MGFPYIVEYPSKGHAGISVSAAAEMGLHHRCIP